MSNAKEKFLPIIIGTDLNCYTMSISFHQEYDIKSIVVGRSPLPFTEGSTIIEKFYYTDRIDDTEFFINYLNEIAEEYAPYYENLLLIGTNDKYVTFIIQNKEELSKNFKFSYIDEELRKQLFNKKSFYKLCVESGVEIPLTFFYSCETTELFNEKVPFPLIVKPSNGIEYYNNPFEGMQKVYKVEDYDELHQVIDKIKASGYRDELIIQDYIPGDDTYMWDSVYYGSQSGEPQYISLGQVILQEPTTTGVGNYTSIITRYNKELMDKLLSFLKDINYRGFANFDIKYDTRDGKFKLFEVNVRQGRSSYYLTQHGHNIAKIIVDDVIYQSEKKLTYVKGDNLFSVVPKGVLKKYVKNPEIVAEINTLIGDGHYHNPIFYKGDKGIRRRLFMMLRQVNYYRKYETNPLLEDSF